MGDVLMLTDDTFSAEVDEYEGVCLVDFFAVWCTPCKMMAPLIEQLAEEYADRAKVAKVDVGAHAQIAARFGIMNIPTVIIFKNGETAETLVGALPKQDLVDKLEAHL